MPHLMINEQCAIIKDLQNTGVGTSITFPFNSPTCRAENRWNLKNDSRLLLA